MLKTFRNKNWNMNLGIAKSHQLAGQIVGMQLSIANVLALVVSAASVIAGATMLAVQQFPSGWPLWLAAAGIGTGLAILIEGLTLSALIRIRVAGREIRKREALLSEERDAHVKGLAFPDPTHADYPVLKKHYHDVRKMIGRDYQRARWQQTRQARRDRRNSLLQATGGCIASMCGGGLFYHAILGGLGPIVSVLLSVVFTLAVTGTFISSEVFKDLQEQAIREAFANGNLAEGAMRQETRMQSLWAVYGQTRQFFQSPDALRVIAEGGELLVTSILEDLHQDLRRALTPEERPSSRVVPSQAQSSLPPKEQALPISLPLASHSLQTPVSSDGEMQEQGEGTFPEAAMNEDFLRRASDGQRKERRNEEVDGIGQMMLEKIGQMDPSEYDALLKLAQTSISDAIEFLHHRYPHYAHLFTEKRIHQIRQIISQRQVASHTPSSDLGQMVDADALMDQTVDRKSVV